jgi:chromosomal replication initiation ATPase DnaA
MGNASKKPSKKIAVHEHRTSLPSTKRESSRAQRNNVLKIHMRLDNKDPNYEFNSTISKYRDSNVFKPPKESQDAREEQIAVCIRKRPFNEAEIAINDVEVISVPTNYEIIVHSEKRELDLTKYIENLHFRFDYAFDENCENSEVYEHTAKPLVENVLEGGMSTCFAYGQTGSGKTHTMGGCMAPSCEKGLYSMTAEDVFKFLKARKYKRLKMAASASFFEIYCGEVYDLLANSGKLRVREDADKQVQIEGLTEKPVRNMIEFHSLLDQGIIARTSAETSENYRSSRSHAVLQIIIRREGTENIYGRFSLVDLAGNERGIDTFYSNRRIKIEGADINKSLLSLKECIRAMGRKSARIPFRASKLTQILRDCFIGKNSKACLIAMLNPGLRSYEYSLNTLRFANRVKEQKHEMAEQLEKHWKELHEHLMRRRSEMASAHRRTQRQRRRHFTIEGSKLDEERLRHSLGPYQPREPKTMMDTNIVVCIRKRPFRKTDTKEPDVISVPSDEEVVVHAERTKMDRTKYILDHCFKFDFAFDESCNTTFVYEHVARPLVKNMFEGGMSACFTFGQSGSGKTHTMFGRKSPVSEKGIYAMAAEDVFKFRNLRKYKGLDLTVSASFYEIYCGEIFDLLTKGGKLDIREYSDKTVQIVGLTEKTAISSAELLRLIKRGSNARKSRNTSENYRSSRSHAVFQIILRKHESRSIHGKFSLVDLADNQSGADKKVWNRKKRLECADINRSLLALRECMRALGKMETHIPFRCSKLTYTLRDSFVGSNSKTCIIATINPGVGSCEHTLNTLRFVDRIKERTSIEEQPKKRRSH